MSEAAPSFLRWENAASRRYYEVRVTPDLFGDWCVVRSWGGIGTSLGAIRTDVSAEMSDAQRLIGVIEKRRLQRGYELAVRRR